MLVIAWNADKYIAGCAASLSDNEFNPGGMTIVLRDKTWFATLYMVDALNRIPETVQEIVESCPCHGKLMSSLKRSERIIKYKDFFGADGQSCPMAGNMLPYLCAGVLTGAFQERSPVPYRQSAFLTYSELGVHALQCPCNF